MKTISEKEYQNLVSKYSVRGDIHPIVSAIVNLPIGDALLIAKEEWTKKTPLSVYIGNYRNRLNFRASFKNLKGKGYLIQRTG